MPNAHDVDRLLMLVHTVENPILLVLDFSEGRSPASPFPARTDVRERLQNIGRVEDALEQSVRGICVNFC